MRRHDAPTNKFFGTAPMPGHALPGRACPSHVGVGNASFRQSIGGSRVGRDANDGQHGQGGEQNVMTELERLLLGRNPRDVHSDSFTIPDPPGNPMNFGRWNSKSTPLSATQVPAGMKTA